MLSVAYQFIVTVVFLFQKGTAYRDSGVGLRMGLKGNRYTRQTSLVHHEGSCQERTGAAICSSCSLHQECLFPSLTSMQKKPVYLSRTSSVPLILRVSLNTLVRNDLPYNIINFLRCDNDLWLWRRTALFLGGAC